MSNNKQKIVFPDGNVGTVVEAEGMLSAIAEDAQNASHPSDKSDLESLHGWLQESLSAQQLTA